MIQNLHGLDRVDLAILERLQADGALSAAQVAEHVGVTPATAWRRITRLESLGVIRRRVAILGRRDVGLQVMIFAHVKLVSQGRDTLARFESAVRLLPEVLECYTMLGETDFLLRIVAPDIDAYETFYRDHLSRLPGVHAVNSSITLSVIKETTALPLGHLRSARGGSAPAAPRKSRARE
jgi:Lrp/AsnC family transcriptional regulator